MIKDVSKNFIPSKNLPVSVKTISIPFLPLVCSIGALVLVILIATGIGSVKINPLDTTTAIWHGITGNLSSTTDTIIWKIRLPRVLLAGLVGAALSLSGLAYQGIFRNPLADPYLLGSASGAGFAATVVLIYGGSSTLLAQIGVPMAAFVGALLSVLTVVFLARQGTRLHIVALILSGVVVGSSLTALTSFMMLMAREQTNEVLAWMLGSFSLATWAKLTILFPLVLITFILLFILSKALNLLQLGDEQAMQLGIPVERLKFILLTIASLATAAAVSVSGIIGFVGLMIPHAVRLAFGGDYRKLLPLGLIWGAAFMILADLIARTLISPSEIPVGVITALVGGPFFLYLLKRRSF